MENFANGLKPYLRSTLDAARAAAIIEALCLTEVYDLLVRRSGWFAYEYQDWLFQTLKNELLPTSSS